MSAIKAAVVAYLSKEASKYARKIAESVVGIMYRRSLRRVRDMGQGRSVDGGNDDAGQGGGVEGGR